MRKNFLLAVLVLLLAGLKTSTAAASSMQVEIKNTSVSGSALTFDVYMGGGLDYGTPTSNMNSANIVYEIENGTGSTANFLPASGTITPAGGNFNNYLTSVYMTSSPLFPMFMQSPTSTGAFNFNITRNVLGNNLDFQPGVRVFVFSVSIPYTGTVYAGTKLSLRTTTTATNLFGSSWSTGTTLNQAFTAPLPEVMVGIAAANPAAMKVDIRNTSLSASTLTFDVYMGGGSAYNSPIGNMNSANIVYEIQNGTGSTGSFQPSMGTITPAGGNYNNYLTSVYITSSPLYAMFLQSPLATGAFNFNVTRNILGANLDFIADSLVKVFTVSIPYTGTITAGTKFSLRTVTTATNPFGSSWSIGSILNQPFVSPHPSVILTPAMFIRQANTMTQWTNSVNVAPNPCNAATQLIINADQDQVVNYAVVDASGRSVKGGRINVTAGANQQPLDMQDLAAGMYFVKVGGTSVSGQLTVIKQ